MLQLLLLSPLFDEVDVDNDSWAAEADKFCVFADVVAKFRGGRSTVRGECRRPKCVLYLAVPAVGGSSKSGLD